MLLKRWLGQDSAVVDEPVLLTWILSICDQQLCSFVKHYKNAEVKLMGKDINWGIAKQEVHPLIKSHGSYNLMTCQPIVSLCKK